MKYCFDSITPRARVIALAVALTIALAFLTPPSPHAEGPPAFAGLARQFTLIRPPRPAPLTPILDGAGATLDLSRFRGRVVLLNFWATWCAPCVREMPTLDRLQAELGGARFAVVALSADRKGAAAVKPFLKRLGLEHLGVYIDSRRAAARAFGVQGLPTTYLIDRRGRIAGWLEGPAEWDSPEAKALIRYYMDGE